MRKRDCPLWTVIFLYIDALITEILLKVALSKKKSDQNQIKSFSH
jgi:hypothetical protein